MASLRTESGSGSFKNGRIATARLNNKHQLHPIDTCTELIKTIINRPGGIPLGDPPGLFLTALLDLNLMIH
ncbi:hypothetical protein D3C78_1718670 [compost metagenome]